MSRGLITTVAKGAAIVINGVTIEVDRRVSLRITGKSVQIEFANGRSSAYADGVKMGETTICSSKSSTLSIPAK